MKLQSFKSYVVKFPDGVRKATFLSWSGKGWCKVEDMHGTGPLIKHVRREKILEPWGDRQTATQEGLPF